MQVASCSTLLLYARSEYQIAWTVQSRGRSLGRQTHRKSDGGET
jgi:hypothetical protein